VYIFAEVTEEERQQHITGKRNVIDHRRETLIIPVLLLVLTEITLDPMLCLVLNWQVVVLK
jgi:hypothetical protein